MSDPIKVCSSDGPWKAFDPSGAGLRRLVWGALASLANSDEAPSIAWGLVTDRFGIGSTHAAELLREFGYDPHEYVAPGERMTRTEGGASAAIPDKAGAKIAPYIDIVFDGPPGPECGRFVEVEEPSGASIGVGEWVKRDDGYDVLRIPDHRLIPDLLAVAGMVKHLASNGGGVGARGARCELIEERVLNNLRQAACAAIAKAGAQ